MTDPNWLIASQITETLARRLESMVYLTKILHMTLNHRTIMIQLDLPNLDNRAESDHSLTPPDQSQQKRRSSDGPER